VTAFFAFIVAMFIAMVLIPPLMRSAQRFALVDLPSERKLHEAPTPRIGGLAMVAGTVTPILLWVEPSRSVLGLLYGVAVLLIFGLWDDRSPLDYRLKFTGQIIAVSVAVFYGDIVIRFAPFAGIDPIAESISIPLTIFALLGVTNAINLSDGLDGLAGGTTLLSVGTLSLMAYLAGDATLFLVSMAVMGAIIGFLRYNTFPAQVFMGDAGSQFLGFSAGVLVILLTQQSSVVLSPSMPLLLLGLPLIDTFLVIGQRVFEGRSPFKPDRNHVHHKLLQLGFDHYESVIMIYALQAALVTTAFLCRYQSDLLNMSVFSAVLFGLAGLFVVATRRNWHVGQREGDTPSAVTRFARRLKRRAVLTRIPMLFAAFSMPLFSTYAIMNLDVIPADGRFTSIVLWCATMVAFVLRGRAPEFSLPERLILYVAITTIVFYWCSTKNPGAVSGMAENLYFIVLGAGIIVAYRFGYNRSFIVTPTDFLIILIALLVPTIMGSLLPQTYIGEVAIKTLVMFYAVELVLAEVQARVWHVRAAVCFVLTLLAGRLLLYDIPVAG
jgi:UDP-GlcNAc:undecaprenyl-phosphate/decaprenyl-phosphate GlcNAc-1-phosphate transferase